MVNNNPANFLAEIMKNSEGFVKSIQNGEAFLKDIPAEKREEAKKEYKKQMNQRGLPKLLKDLENNMNEFKEISKKMK